jgi:hypothetical protein
MLVVPGRYTGGILKEHMSEQLWVLVRKAILALLVGSVLAGCSTTGGIYSKDDAQNSEFSAGRTALTILGIIGAAAVARRGGGGGASAYGEEGYAWDYQPGNRQWVCRDKANGQYTYASNCAGVPMVDYWP